MRLLRAAGVSVMVATAILGLSPAANATSCAVPAEGAVRGPVTPQFGGIFKWHDTVVVATVVRTGFDGKQAFARVDDAWKGSVKGEIEVRAGDPQYADRAAEAFFRDSPPPLVGTTFAKGDRWLLFGPGPPFVVGGCGDPSRPFTEELAEYREIARRAPPGPPGFPWLQTAAAVGGGVAVLVGMGLALRRWR